MSFVFRGSRADIEAGGFPGFAPERRAMRVHAGSRPVNSNSLAFLLTVLVLFMILNSHQMSPDLLLWLVLGVFLMATSLRMYATCQQLAHAAAANNFVGHTELRVHVPPTIALATRGRLQSLRLQLALLDREFDDLDYDTLRALDADNSPHAPSMSEEEINSLPVFKYKVQAQLGNAPARKSDGPSQLSVSSTGSGNEKKQDVLKADGTSKTPEDELTCSVCLEQVAVGDLLRSLPCLHQFHVNCIDPWLRQQGTCPICKHQDVAMSRATRLQAALVFLVLLLALQQPSIVPQCLADVSTTYISQAPNVIVVPYKKPLTSMKNEHSDSVSS